VAVGVESSLAAAGAVFSEPVFLTSAVTVLSTVLGEEVTFMVNNVVVVGE
jgi:hypothetical protein